jgi:uncharacterized membrane protein
MAFVALGLVAGTEGMAQAGLTFTFTSFDVPFAGASDTEASGINDAGQIVGLYSDASGGHGFLKDGSTYTSLDVPFAGASGTEALGINNAGAIVGYYFDASFSTHGFIATPVTAAVPEPSSLVPGSTAALIWLGYFWWRRRYRAVV